MHVDLFTLYLIIIGTLLASACLTYWGAPDPSRPQYVAAAVGGRLRHARGGLLHRSVPRGPARGAGLGAEQPGHPERLSAGAERRGRAQRAAVPRRLAGPAGRHGADLGRRGLFRAEPGLDLCRLSHRAGQRHDGLGTAALPGIEIAVAAAHRGGRDQPCTRCSTWVAASSRPGGWPGTARPRRCWPAISPCTRACCIPSCCP